MTQIYEKIQNNQYIPNTRDSIMLFIPHFYSIFMNTTSQVQITFMFQFQMPRPNQGLSLNLINDWESITAYWEESERSEANVAHCKNSWRAQGDSSSAITVKLCNFYHHLSLETKFPALKLPHNCCIMNIGSSTHLKGNPHNLTKYESKRTSNFPTVQ